MTNTDTSMETTMQVIFQQYLERVLGERPLPPKSRARGINRKYFQDFLCSYARFGGAQPLELLKLAKEGNGDARRLLISAAVKGYEREAEASLKYEKSKEVANV